MELEMAKQAAAAENASSSATAKTGRTKSEASAGSRATKQSSAKPAASPAVLEKSQKKTRRAVSVATPAGEMAPEKPKKTKVVRDSFTMPEADYRMLAELKERCLAGGKKVKKSELLRAGVNLLAAMPANRLLAVLAKLDSVKTGRPTKV